MDGKLYLEDAMKLNATILAVFVAVVLPFGTGGGSVRAQLAEPLRIGNASPLQDVFGRVLDGKAYLQRARVDVFSVELKKPAKLLTNTLVGANAMPGSGFFSVVLRPAPAAGSTIRAVVYDAATSNDACFYTSATATVPGAGRILLPFGDPKPMAKFGTGTNATHAAYEDLLNRLKTSGVDSDEDGMSDYAEILAGTDSENEASLLAFSTIHAESATPADGTCGIEAGDGEKLFNVILAWQAVSGITYRLQYTLSLLPDKVAWEDILDPFKCTADDLEPSGTEGIQLVRRSVTIPLDSPFLQGHFRVLVVRSADDFGS